MRILHVIPSLAARDGGPAKAAIEMCRELLRRGVRAEIYTTNADGRGCLDVPLARPTKVRGIRVTYFAVNGSHYFKFSLALAAALKANVRRFDLVHINSLYQFPSTAAAHYCRKYAVPYLIRPHGTLDPYIYRRHPLRKRLFESLVERRNLSVARVVHFTTSEEMELARSLGFSFRGAVVPLGVDPDGNLSTEASAAEAFWPEVAGKKVVLFLGRINFKKGLDILSAAFADVRTQRQDSHLVIAGPDTDGYAAQVREWLGSDSVLDSVTFTGMVTGARKAALLKRADLFVLPSYSENFGIAVVEAMAVGLPVVISNKVNIWREVEAGGAGLVVNPEPGETAAAILKLLDAPVLGRQMGERGVRLVREKFSWNSAGAQLVELYRGAILRSTSTSGLST